MPRLDSAEFAPAPGKAAIWSRPVSRTKVNQGFRRLGTVHGVLFMPMNNILVIDDKEDIRTLIKAVLSNYGFNVIEAESGRMGVQMLQDQKPDLVVCDVNMPGMDGYQTLGAVRDSSATAPVPFILMTGLVSRDGFRRGMA